MLKKLRIKIVCFTMGIVTVMLCAIFGTVYHFTSQSLEAESIRMMESMAATPFQLGRPDERSEEIRLPYFILQINARGDLLAAGGGYYDLSDEEFLEEVISAAFSTVEQTGILEEYDLRFLRVEMPQGQRIVFADTSSEQATLHSLINTSILIGLASLLIFFFISLLLAHMAVKPVEQAWNQQRQFVADASHELKTPLTVIITNTEMMKSLDYTPEQKSQFVDSIHSMSQQMRGLTEKLLDLARVDAESDNMTFTDLNFSELVSECVMLFESLYFENGLQLESKIEPDLTLNGSASHLQQVADILLDNAMKYSFPGSQVFVRLKKQGNHALLTVSNPGKEISPEDLKNIFKRFYRVDEARSMNHSYGLGLPIAEGIVKAHHGKIWAESAGGMNTFSVQLPL